jgi:cap1 methyltransferase
MDPCLFLLYNENPLPLKYFQVTTPITDLPLNVKKVPVNSVVPEMYCDNIKNDKVNQEKNKFDNYSEKEFLSARRRIDDLYNDRKKFANNAELKLANIDAVIKLTKDQFTLNKTVSSLGITFADIAAGPGGFTKYIIKRYPNYYGYAITLTYPEVNNSLNWYKDLLKLPGLEFFYGEDKSGDIYKYYQQFIKQILTAHPTGLDLALADGGIETAYTTQEFQSSKLLLYQAYIGLSVGQRFLLKLFNGHTRISAELIYLLALAYEKVIIFKPLSSRMTNNEKYIICINRRNNISYISDYLHNILQQYSNNILLESMFGLDYKLPDDFERYLTESNNTYLEYSLKALKEFNTFLEQPTLQKIPNNSAKFLTMCNLLNY